MTMRTDNIFRFSIEVSPPVGDVRVWNEKLMAAIITAVRDLDGALVADGQGSIRYSIERLAQKGQGLH